MIKCKHCNKDISEQITGKELSNAGFTRAELQLAINSRLDAKINQAFERSQDKFIEEYIKRFMDNQLYSYGRELTSDTKKMISDSITSYVRNELIKNFNLKMTTKEV